MFKRQDLLKSHFYLKTFDMHDLSLKIRYWLPCLWFASIPLGPSIQSILFVLTLLIGLADIKNIKPIVCEKWYIFLTVAVGYSLLSLIWSPAVPDHADFYIKKHLDLLLIPVLALSFQNEEQKTIALKAFLFSAFIPLLIAIYLKIFNISIHADADQGHIFYNHIITGFYSAIAAFISFQFYMIETRKIYLLIFFLFSVQCLFLNTGRFAYLLYFALIGLSVYSSIPKKHLLFASILGLIVFLFGIHFSDVIQSGIQSFLQDIQKFQHGDKQSSLGFRIQFHAFAIQQFLHHPYFGNGIGGFDALFTKLLPVPSWEFKPNTHSQYLLFACDYGFVGLFLWSGFFYYLIRNLKTAPYLHSIFYGFMLALALNFFTDNLLYASPGHLLMAMIAIFYSPLKKKNPCYQ